MKSIIHSFLTEQHNNCKKQFLQIAVFMLVAFAAQAQVPQAMNYQAVVRDNNGAVLANQSVNMRFTVRNNTATGTAVYRETKALTTNSLGLVTHAIGTGTVVSGTFAGINWGSGSKYLQVEIDAAGGNNFTDLGSSELLSVPYALYAANGGGGGATGATGPTGATGAAGQNGSNGVTGATGPTGAAGVKGATGATGATGAAGTNGSNGATGATGAAGADGKTVLNGSSNPTAGVGTNGDFYINTTTNTLFGPKAAGAWGAGTSLVGPAGATGGTGATGPAGPQGPSGVVNVYSISAAAGQVPAGGVNAPWTFIGGFAVVPIATGQRITGSGVASLGTASVNPGTANPVSFCLCWSENFNGATLTPFYPAAFLDAQVSVRLPYSAAATVTLPAGTYRLGYCVKNKSANVALQNTDYVNAWFMVTQ